MNNQSSDKQDRESDDTFRRESAFECNICLETAKDAVVSMCGHLFCWPCLHQWMYATDINDQSHKTCPVCKSAISREKTIPIYGRSGDESNRQDPRDKLPPRPPGQRTEVPNQQNQSMGHTFPYGNVWPMGGLGPQVYGSGYGGYQLYFGFDSLPHYIVTFIQGLRFSDQSRNDTDYFMTRFFAICGFLCVFITLYLCD